MTTVTVAIDYKHFTDRANKFALQAQQSIKCFMEKKKKQSQAPEVSIPDKQSATEIPFDPERPIAPIDADPDLIPEEDPFENAPFEIPQPGEGP